MFLTKNLTFSNLEMVKYMVNTIYVDVFMVEEIAESHKSSMSLNQRNDQKQKEGHWVKNKYFFKKLLRNRNIFEM